MKNLLGNIGIIICIIWVTGCAQVPMAPPEADAARKSFNPPTKGMSGLYIFRDSTFGGALLKSIYIDGKFLGESAPNVYFYTELAPGKHTLSTESEFSENHFPLTMEADQNYFIRQYIKMGLFVGGANFEQVTPDEGKRCVRECGLALPGKSQSEGQPEFIAAPRL